MQQRLYVKRNGYNRDRDVSSSLMLISQTIQSIDTSGSSNQDDKIGYIISVLNKLQYPIRKTTSFNVNSLFESIANLLITVESESCEEWTNSFISNCYKQSFVFSVSLIQSSIRQFKSNTSKTYLLRLVSYGIESNGKCLSEKELLSLLSLLVSFIQENQQNENLYSILLCCSSICHLSSFISSPNCSPHLSQLNNSLQKLIQSLPVTDMEMKIHSLCLHILSLTPHSLTAITGRIQPSSLLSRITTSLLHTEHPSADLSKYVSSCIHYSRVFHKPSTNGFDTVMELSHLVQWVLEWKGDASVIHQSLSSIRSIMKDVEYDWVDLNESFTNQFSLFINWSCDILQLDASDINLTELLRTLQVCLKYTPFPHFSSEYGKVYDVVLRRVMNYQTRYSYPVQDMTILLSQFYSFNSFNERYDWLLPRVHEFPWESLCGKIFSPFLPLSFQKNLSQFVSHLLLVFASELNDEEKSRVMKCLKVETVETLSVNECICLGICLEGVLTQLFHEYQASLLQVVSVLIFHVSSSVKERVFQTLLVIPEEVLIFCVPMLSQSLYHDITFSLLCDQKIRIITRLGNDFDCSKEVFSHILQLVLNDFIAQHTGTLLHILQFLSTFSERIQDQTGRITDLVSFILTCDDCVIQAYIQVITRIARYLSIPEIEQLLGALGKENQVSSQSLFPFLLSLLQYHAFSELSKELGRVYGLLLVKACGEIENMKQVIVLLHSFTEKPVLLDEQIHSVVCCMEEYLGNGRNRLSFLELAIGEETLKQYREWIA